MLREVIPGFTQPSQVDHTPYVSPVRGSNEIPGSFPVAPLKAGPATRHGMNEIISNVYPRQGFVECSRLKQISLHDLGAIQSSRGGLTHHAAHGKTVLNKSL